MVESRKMHMETFRRLKSTHTVNQYHTENGQHQRLDSAYTYESVGISGDLLLWSDHI